ncbi:tropomyosin-2 [Basidiobolus ranarum]|uniref:Tropomyosin-2 n=1 Tax=Basidiobolus ranarum TaxID=34480 RepID=A0ABR2WL23_9FUNG
MQLSLNYFLEVRLNTLRAEADAAATRAEEAEAQLKKLNETQLDHDQDLEDDQEKFMQHISSSYIHY